MTISLHPEPGRSQQGLRLLARIAAGLALPLTLLPPRGIAVTLRLMKLGARDAPAILAAEARQDICSVSTRCAGQGCLQRSIAVCILCRFRGMSPDWCTGYMARPFVAHAWVECGGEPIGEAAEVRDYVTVISVRGRSTTSGPSPSR